MRHNLCRVFHTLELLLDASPHVPLRCTWGYKYFIGFADLPAFLYDAEYTSP